MIFILLESYMNGTVTLSTAPSIVKAKDFNTACKKIINILSKKKILYTPNEATDNVFSYNIWQDRGFIYGRIENKMIPEIK